MRINWGKGVNHSLRQMTAAGVLLAVLSSIGSASPTLLDRSPFVPSDFDPDSRNIGTDPAANTPTGYEFRGVYQIGDRYWFLISEPASQDGNWIELGKSSENLLARSFDPETRSLVLVSNNTEHTLELASVESNPTPIPVKGLVKTATRTPTRTAAPVRRTIRPTSSITANNEGDQNNRRNAAPPPAWLEKLRAEAAERRARGQQRGRDARTEENNRRSITPNRPTRRTQDSSTAPPGEEPNDSSR